MVWHHVHEPPRVGIYYITTPPFAVYLYVVKGVLSDEVTLSQRFRGTLWFLVADVANLFPLYSFPQIASLRHLARLLDSVLDKCGIPIDRMDELAVRQSEEQTQDKAEMHCQH